MNICEIICTEHGWVVCGAKSEDALGSSGTRYLWEIGWRSCATYEDGASAYCNTMEEAFDRVKRITDIRWVRVCLDTPFKWSSIEERSRVYGTRIIVTRPHID